MTRLFLGIGHLFGLLCVMALNGCLEPKEAVLVIAADTSSVSPETGRGSTEVTVDCGTDTAACADSEFHADVDSGIDGEVNTDTGVNGDTETDIGSEATAGSDADTDTDVDTRRMCRCMSPAWAPKGSRRHSMPKG